MIKTLVLFGALLLLSFLVYLFIFYVSGFISLIFGAPYIPLDRKLIKRILHFGGLSSDDIFCDLGSGDGRILLTSVKNFNVSEAIGYEIAPWPFLKSQILMKLNNTKNVKIFRKNFLKANLNNISFIYIYLFPKLINKVAHKISEDVKKELKVLCVQFPIDTNKHQKFNLLKSEKIGDLTAYLYKFNP